MNADYSKQGENGKVKEKIYDILTKLVPPEELAPLEECEAVEDIFRELNEEPSEVEIIFATRKYLGLPIFV